MPVDQATADKISSFYQTYLGRAPEAGAVDSWASAGDTATIEAGIRNSTEAKSWVNPSPTQAAPGSTPAPGMLGATSATNYTPGRAGAAGYTPPTPSSTPGNPGELYQPTAASPSPAPAPAAAAAPKPSANVANWYRSVLGRDAEQGGLDFWQNAVNAGGNVDDIYNSFVSTADKNRERVNTGMSWAKASDYRGPNSVNTTTPVDDWGRNVLGRELSPAELQTWQAKFDAAGGQDDATGKAAAVYQEFLQANSGDVRNNMDLISASQINSGLTPEKGVIPTGPSYLDPNSLERRRIDPKTETVQGQMTDLLRKDSPYLAQARYDAMKVANERGMLNSAMAASAGEDAAIRNALGIATPDAGYYNKASDYNVAVGNEARKFNVESANQFAMQQQQFNNQMGLQQAQFFNQKELQTMQNNQQLTMQQLQDATTRWTTLTNAANSRYNTDASYRQQQEGNRQSLVNNVIMNNELSPDRKAAMLANLGEGTAARIEKQPDGSSKVIPGTGLAGSVYIIDDVAKELRDAARNNVYLGENYQQNFTE